MVVNTGPLMKWMALTVTDGEVTYEALPQLTLQVPPQPSSPPDLPPAANGGPAQLVPGHSHRHLAPHRL